uniref:Uncharacterized protein n=1 Tax=Candidatus Hodgkinia cicadicola TaxID=573658 RepID=A0A097GZU4_9HYPH|nr:hypothetical protein HCTETAUR1_009 [Candidatus Hodgkinia cicadicola]
MGETQFNTNTRCVIGAGLGGKNIAKNKNSISIALADNTPGGSQRHTETQLRKSV